MLFLCSLVASHSCPFCAPSSTAPKAGKATDLISRVGANQPGTPICSQPKFTLCPSSLLVQAVHSFWDFSAFWALSPPLGTLSCVAWDSGLAKEAALVLEFSFQNIQLSLLGCGFQPGHCHSLRERLAFLWSFLYLISLLGLKSGRSSFLLGSPLETRL